MTKLSILWLCLIFLTRVSLANSLLSLSPSDLAAVNTKVAKEGELTSFAELKPLVRHLEQKLNSPEILQLVGTNPELERVRQMVLTSFFHIDLKFNVQVEDYPYEIPFKEPFPYRPTMDAFAESLEFLEMVQSVSGKDLQLKQIFNGDQASWFSALTSERSKFNVGPSSTLANSIEPEKRVVKNPFLEYRRFLRRLQREGENASFYEFKPTVEKIEKELLSEATLSYIENNPALRFMHSKAVNVIKQVQLQQANGSLTVKPYQVMFPYRATIQAIYKSVRFFEVLERSKFIENPDSQAVERSWDSKADPKSRMIEPLYHFDRYKYHSFDILGNPEVIVWPTTHALGFQELIRVRGVLIGFVGVETKTIRVDRHYQTPIDFWYHDINHVRRMMGYIFKLLKERKAVAEDEKLAVYKEVDELVEGLLEKVKLPPKPVRPSQFSNKQEEVEFNESMERWNNEAALRRLVRIILFEIVHESALAGDKKSILQDLMRGPETPQPFEYHSITEVGVGKGIQSLEQLRMETGNLESGAKKMRKLKGDSPVNVLYMNDRSLSLLSNVMNKIMHGFYDSTNDPKSYVVPVEYRTPENIAIAAEQLFGILGEPPPPREKLMDYILSRKGSPEKYIKYKGLIIPVAIKEVDSGSKETSVNTQVLIEVVKAHMERDKEEGDSFKKQVMREIVSQNPDSLSKNAIVPWMDAQDVDEIERKVKSLGKKVHSLFGYSALDYEDKPKLLEQIRHDLEKMDPKTTIINIGVTPEGLGVAYELAKEMGFETMGLVSSKFLERGGNYSEFVDHIYVVKDKQWGGYAAGSQKMTPTTALYVKLSDSMTAYGGGDITKITMSEFSKTGRPIRYHPFDMNHEKAVQSAKDKGRSAPKKFNSSVDSLWTEIKINQCEKWYRK